MSTHKPSVHENEYFAREDTDKRELLALERAHAQHVARRAEAAARGPLRCPRCETPMRAVEGSVGAAVSCERCQGMFLEAADLKAASGREGYVTHLLRQVVGSSWR